MPNARYGMRKKIARIGWLLLVIGVLGEGVFEMAVSQIDGLLQSFNGAELTEAVRKAGSAAEAASRANDSASKSQTLAESVEKKAKKLDGRITAAKGQLADAVAAEKQEEQTLINMAICSAPRVIWKWTMGKKTEADPLLPMAGEKVFIEFIPGDPEAKRAAFNLVRALSDANWDMQPLRIIDGLADGVSVQPSMAGTEPPLSPEAFSAFMHVSDVADKLVEFLHLYNWQAQRGWPQSAQGKLLRDPNALPPGAIRVQIGLYPAVEYVSPPGEKELRIGLEERRREGEKAMVEVKRQREEQLSTLPPEIRKRLQESAAKADTRWKKTMENMTYPCQVLNPLP
jgi:hypothetical protein